MISIKSIRDIVLGPRQLSLFDSDDRTADEQERLLSCLSTYVEQRGQADVHEFVRMAVVKLDWPESKVWQQLFWLAHDLKIHFRQRHERIDAAAARKILAESWQPELQVVLNKPVDETVFCIVKASFERWRDDAAADGCRDQNDLARLLARQIVHWKNTLDWCRQFVRRPRFPGEQDIETSLETLQVISAKLDSFSLLHAFCEHSERIDRLVGTTSKLTNFYSRHAEGWSLMVRFAEELTDTLPGILEDPACAAAYEHFNRILSSAQPYDQVDHARRLQETLKPRHDEIMVRQVQKNRTDALALVQSWIREMQGHLRAHAAADDLCNRSLYPLRSAMTCIEAARTMAAIERHIQTAQESFETAWEDVVQESAGRCVRPFVH